MLRKVITIHPESGRLTVDLTYGDGSQTCLIEFGNSFTLRLEEHDIDQLRHALYEASRELMFEKNAIDAAKSSIPRRATLESVIEPELWARLQK